MTRRWRRGGAKWSKLKAAVESFFATSLAGRVELRYTRYRGAHDQTGRGYLVVDGDEVWNMCTLRFWAEERRRMDVRREATGDSPGAAQRAVAPDLLAEGILAEWDFVHGLQRYLSSSIEENVASANPLIRSLAMLDRRFGKRRLIDFDASKEHEIVRYFHALRCAAESLEGARRHSPGDDPDSAARRPGAA